MNNLLPTSCPLCGTWGNSTTVYESTIDENSISVEVFSARRIPDRRHYRWVRCNSCTLLRSDPVLDIDLAQLYLKSTFDYTTEIDGLKKTYIEIVRRGMKVSFKEKSIFEVGGGNGFFLEAALDSGFTVVRGVEPSVAAAEAARQDIRPHIITSIMKRGVLEQNEFDIGVMFHTLDHLSSPVETLRDCVEALKPGGRLIVAIHNERSWSARLLGKRSPIIDVEHTHLYTKKTAELLFRKVGLTEVTSSSYRNHYSLHYIFHLLPFPSSFKLRVLRSSFGKALQRVKVTLPLGNIWISGLKA